MCSRQSYAYNEFFKRFLLSYGSLQTINQRVYNCSIHQLEIPFELVSQAGDLCYSGSNNRSSENYATQWKKHCCRWL
jgi:hypothetical protein